MKRSCNDQELVQSYPKSCPRNQNGNQSKLQIDVIQREHKVKRSTKLTTLIQKAAMYSCKGSLKSQSFQSTGLHVHLGTQ